MRTSRRPALWRHAPTFAAVLAAAVLLAALAGWAAGKGKQPEAKEAEAATLDEQTPPAKPDSVRIFIQTVPPRKAQVKWGGKLLGVIPTPRALVVERPRDSGPLDLVIRAAGFLPVHTRAYTFSDSRVAVKLTPPSEKNKLFGYREEPPPNPDGGAPSAVPATPPPAPASPAPAAPTPAAR
jgi:hypothetical protein